MAGLKLSRREIVDRSAAIAREVHSLPEGSRRRVRLREDLAAMNYGLVPWASQRCCARLGLPQARWMDDVMSIVNEAYAVEIDRWHPDQPGLLAHHVLSTAWDRVRAWWEAESGFADGSRQRRIGARVERLRDELSSATGRQVSVEEAVQEHNLRFTEKTTTTDHERAMQMLLQPALPVDGDWEFSSADDESPEWVVTAGEDRSLLLGHLFAVIEMAAADNAAEQRRADFEAELKRWETARARASRAGLPEPPRPDMAEKDWDVVAEQHLVKMRSAIRCVVLRVGLDDDGPGRSWAEVAELMELPVSDVRQLWRTGCAAVTERLDVVVGGRSRAA